MGVESNTRGPVARINFSNDHYTGSDECLGVLGDRYLYHVNVQRGGKVPHVVLFLLQHNQKQMPEQQESEQSCIQCWQWVWFVEW